jgi:Ulp1 family protease
LKENLNQPQVFLKNFDSNSETILLISPGKVVDLEVTPNKKRKSLEKNLSKVETIDEVVSDESSEFTKNCKKIFEETFTLSNKSKAKYDINAGITLKLKEKENKKKKNKLEPIMVDISDDNNDKEPISINITEFDRRVTRFCKELEKRKLPKTLFVFPPKNKGAVTITEDDVKLLEPEEFLNDNIIEFYLKFIEQKIVSEDKKGQFHFFNTFFYKRFQRDGFEKVKKWTGNIDIFEKDYLFIPINDKMHWSLIIVCFPGKFSNKSCILHLDSLRGINQSIFTKLRCYLKSEWINKRGNSIDEKDFASERMPGHHVKVPEQDNYTDCGLFLLHYVELWVRNPPDEWQDITPRWFPTEEIKEKRQYLKSLIERLSVNDSTCSGEIEDESFLQETTF